MLLIIDTCAVQVAKEPTGGFTLKLTAIDGLPGIDLVIPIVKESAEQLLEGARKTMGMVETFTSQDVPHV